MTGYQQANESNKGTAGISESFKRRLDEIRKIIDEDKYRQRVLMLCQQTEPRSFEEYSSSGSFRRLEKFESSTYSEVLKAVDMADNNKPVVMKIMRALSRGVIKRVPSTATKGCQSYNDILNELVVTQALSQLHDGVILNSKSLYKTHFFCLIHEIKVVSGNMERTLTKSQQMTTRSQTAAANQEADSNQQIKETNTNKHTEIKDDDSRPQNEDERMLIEALPYEYVVSVMRHEGHPLWWMMTNKKLRPEQLTSVLVQIIVGLAIAERVYLYEHRDLHVSNILVKKTSKSSIPFVLDNGRYNVVSEGVKVTIIDATFSRLTHNGKVYYRDLTSTLRAYGTKRVPPKMSLQNRSYRQMVHITGNKWEEFSSKTNLIWLTYLCETLMKNEVMKSNPTLVGEIQKIRDYTLKVETTLDLLCYFPLQGSESTRTKPNMKAVVAAATAAADDSGSAKAPANQTIEVQKSSTVFSSGTVLSSQPSSEIAKVATGQQHYNRQQQMQTVKQTTVSSSSQPQRVQHITKEVPPAKVATLCAKNGNTNGGSQLLNLDPSKQLLNNTPQYSSEYSSLSVLSKASDAGTHSMSTPPTSSKVVAVDTIQIRKDPKKGPGKN